MRAGWLLLAALAPALAAASAPVVPHAETADSVLARARAEAEQARRKFDRLQADAGKATDEVARLRIERAAAAAGIEAAEARIGESDAELRLARARILLTEQRLAHARAPVAALLAGLVTMGRQPPLLTLASGASVEDLVRIRALLDATMPVIEKRNAALVAELGRRRGLAEEEAAARAVLDRDRHELASRQQRFAELEREAFVRAEALQANAFGAGDRVLASGEALNEAGSEEAEARSGRRSASALLALPFALARPLRGDSPLPPVDLAYSLPAEAPLVEGLGSVDRNGIASRGVRLATGRGAALVAPADGRILFAGPYRDEDGVIIIDHGNGWTSLLLGAASDLPRGSTVRRGEPLGRAVGPVEVELRRKGVAISPALIAASSVPLSNDGKSR
jgi:septal ring factor EnvC (AmiA/AmiB activator)